MKKQLSKSDIKEVNHKLKELYDLEDFFSKKDTLTLVDKEFLVKDKQVLFFYCEGILIPHLKLLQTQMLLKTITVDMGAVKFVINGADIMRPGIVAINEGIVEGAYIAIVDENNKKALAIGQALLSSEKMKEQETGKSIKSVSYVGDDLWSLTF